MGDDILNQTINIGDYITGTTVTSASAYGSTAAIISGSGITAPLTFHKHFDIENFLDEHSFNKFTVDHKLQEHEFMKLKETVPTFADEIKENLSKNLARDIIKKATFTKKKDVDADVHHFLGRVWVFTEDELKNLINEARNV